MKYSQPNGFVGGYIHFLFYFQNKYWNEYHNMEFRKIFKRSLYLVFNDINDTWNLHSVLYLGAQTSPFSTIM